MSNNVLQILGLASNTEISNAAAKFIDHIKGYIRETQDNPSDKKAPAEEQALGILYKGFFEYSMQWAGAERGKYINTPNHPDADNLKQAASDALADLQDNITRFALCYMALARSMGFVNEDIAQYEKNHGAQRKVQWTNDTGVVLGRYRKEKNILEDSNEKLKRGITVLGDVDKHFTALKKHMTSAFGKQAEEVLRPFRSALRLGDFAKAKKTLAAMKKIKRKFALDKKGAEKNMAAIIKEGEACIKILEASKDDLQTTDGKVLLQTNEASVMIMAQEKEIAQKKEFIEKYELPYMEYKLKSLQHLREKLLVVGSLESLMTLYIRMIRGIAQPLSDIKAVREYEAEVIQNVQYLLGGQFQELDNIEKRNADEMGEFRKNLKDFRKAA